MYLHYHSTLHVSLTHFCVYTYHSHLDKIGSRPLNRRVYSVALSKLTHSGRATIDVGQVTSAPQKSFGIAELPCLLHALIHIGTHSGIVLEVAGDKGRSLGRIDIETLTQSIGRYAVDNTKIGSLGMGSLQGRNLLRSHVVDPCGGRAVYIFPLHKSLYQMLVLTKVSHEAKFYLRIIGTQKGKLRAARHESRANFLPHSGANGDVLEIRITRGEAPRNGHGLVVRCTQATIRIDQFRKSLRIGADELFQPSVIQDFLHNRVLIYTFGEHFFARGVGVCLCFLTLGMQAQFFKQDHSHLLRATDIERVPSPVEYCVFCLAEVIRKLLRDLMQSLYIQLYSLTLHALQHSDEGHLYLQKKFFLLLLL